MAEYAADAVFQANGRWDAVSFDETRGDEIASRHPSKNRQRTDQPSDKQGRGMNIWSPSGRV